MTTPVSDQLANALGRADESRNIAVAEKIASSADKASVKELIELLKHKKTAVRSDVIKVLYEVAERNVDLVLPYTEKILALLEDSNNRMKWGAMTVLAAISNAKPDLITGHLHAILEAMDSGTVITRDNGIIILCNAANLKSYHADCMELLLEQIENAPVNQVPMYAEKVSEVISQPYLKRFEKVLRSRKDVLDIPSKQKRIEKLLKNLKFILLLFSFASAFASAFI